LLSIREAKKSDVNELFNLCIEMHKEGIYQKIEINQEKLTNFLLSKINHKESLLLVLTDGDKLVGLFIGDIVEYFFSSEKLALDTIFYIVKSKRKSFGAIKLLVAYFDWANSHNVREICLSSTNGIEVEKIEKMYTKLGFYRVGIMYKKGNENVSTSNR